MYDEIHTRLVKGNLTGNEALRIVSDKKVMFSYEYIHFFDVINFDKKRFKTAMRNAFRLMHKQKFGLPVDHNDVPKDEKPNPN